MNNNIKTIPEYSSEDFGFNLFAVKNFDNEGFIVQYGHGTVTLQSDKQILVSESLHTSSALSGLYVLELEVICNHKTSVLNPFSESDPTSCVNITTSFVTKPVVAINFQAIQFNFQTSSSERFNSKRKMTEISC